MYTRNFKLISHGGWKKVERKIEQRMGGSYEYSIALVQRSGSGCPRITYEIGTTAGAVKNTTVTHSAYFMVNATKYSKRFSSFA